MIPRPLPPSERGVDAIDDQQLHFADHLLTSVTLASHLLDTFIGLN